MGFSQRTEDTSERVKSSLKIEDMCNKQKEQIVVCRIRTTPLWNNSSNKNNRANKKCAKDGCTYHVYVHTRVHTQTHMMPKWSLCCENVFKIIGHLGNAIRIPIRNHYALTRTLKFKKRWYPILVKMWSNRTSKGKRSAKL